MGILVRKLESLFVVEAFLDQSCLVLTGKKVAGHLVHLIITACDVMVRERMVKFGIVDQVNTSSRRPLPINILPRCLLLKNICVWVFDWYILFCLLRDSSEETRIQIQNCLSAPIV